MTYTSFNPDLDLTLVPAIIDNKDAFVFQTGHNRFPFDRFGRRAIFLRSAPAYRFRISDLDLNLFPPNSIFNLPRPAPFALSPPAPIITDTDEIDDEDKFVK